MDRISYKQKLFSAGVFSVIGALVMGCPTIPKKATVCDQIPELLLRIKAQHLAPPSSEHSPEIIQECRNSLKTSNNHEAEALRILDRYLRSLDPHSRVEPENIDLAAPNMLGLRLDLVKMPPRIVEVIPGSPAHMAGIEENGFILSINQLKTEKLSATEFANLKNSRKLWSLEIEKEDGVIRTYSVEADFFIESPVTHKPFVTPSGLVGYIRLKRFNSFEDKRDFADTLKSFEDAGAVILDLRDNPGGDVHAAAEIANHFVTNGGVFARFLGNTGQVTEEILFPRKNSTWDGPLVVLINWATRSAAELIAAALQDYGAIIIGERSFGQGTSHSPIYLNSFGLSGKAQLTDAFNYRPSGEPLQLSGVTPDISLNLSKSSPSSVLMREEKYKEPSAIPRPRSLEPLEGYDPQILTRSPDFLRKMQSYHQELARKPKSKRKRKQKHLSYSTDIGVDTAVKIGEYLCVYFDGCTKKTP